MLLKYLTTTLKHSYRLLGRRLCIGITLPMCREGWGRKRFHYGHHRAKYPLAGATLSDLTVYLEGIRFQEILVSYQEVPGFTRFTLYRVQLDSRRGKGLLSIFREVLLPERAGLLCYLPPPGIPIRCIIQREAVVKRGCRFKLSPARDGLAITTTPRLTSKPVANRRCIGGILQTFLAGWGCKHYHWVQMLAK